ncbi:MAG: hypothetical protein LBH66_08550 [Oscillospiraceae bacterium]|nr:hypothetical protein [Oscillospiraceae bacterium]
MMIGISLSAVRRFTSLVLLAFLVLGLAVSVEAAEDEFQWYIPAQMTDAQMDEMQAIGAKLVTQIDDVLAKYGQRLSPNDLFYYHCLVDHMWDLHIDDDWEEFGEALDSCASAESAALILETPFKGITQAHEGYLPKEQITAIAADILKSAKSDELFDTMIAIPKTCYSEYGLAWAVWLVSSDNAQHAYMQFLRDGRLLEYYNAVLPSTYVD